MEELACRECRREAFWSRMSLWLTAGRRTVSPALQNVCEMVTTRALSSFVAAGRSPCILPAVVLYHALRRMDV